MWNRRLFWTVSSLIFTKPNKLHHLSTKQNISALMECTKLKLKGKISEKKTTNSF